jgi:6-phospho-beta-glucosidase
MARIKLVYIGGGSTRAPGTMASLIHQGKNFEGSEIVMVDVNEERLNIVKNMSQKMAQAAGIDLKISAATNRREALKGCDAVLTSFRPGNFESRYLDESIPLKHGIIGQETQGPGGFFMALRSIHVIKEIVEEMEEICPNAWLFNYTNPVNIVSEAVTHHSSIKTVSLCEGPIVFPAAIVRTAGLDPAFLDVSMVGLNHLYKGEDIMPLLKDAYERLKDDHSIGRHQKRMLKLAVTMESLPADYFQYYYYKEEVLEYQLNKPTTRSQDIMASVDDYWLHYKEQAELNNPQLDPNRSRGGIHELELAFDVMDAVFNDRKEVWPCNVANNGAITDFADDRVVEVPCYVDKNGIHPITQGALPKQVAGLVKMLGEYQSLTAEAAWSGSRLDAIRALASHPLLFSLDKAEQLYDEMAHALKDYLPDRLMC